MAARNSEKSRQAAKSGKASRAVESKPIVLGEVPFEPYLSKEEVARRMGRTVRGVEVMMRRGVIPYYKFDSRAAFRWSEIQSHFAQTFRVSPCPQTNSTIQT